jgi:Tfp pilus assembly protein PilN
MIKINLLNSVTERQASTAVVVERRMSSPASRLLLMTVAVAFLLTAVIGWDIISTQMAKTKAEADLAEQKRIEAELETVSKEMKELEAKIQHIDSRIAAIKKLRDSQAGPSAVLEAMRERIANAPGLYLESVEQTGEQLTVKGNSEDESTVTQFGRSLEFSGGLFSNLNIETQRKEKPNQPQVVTAPGAEAPPKQEIVGFTIRCAYTPSKAKASQNTATTANNTAQPSSTSGGTATVQESVKQQLPKPQTQTDGAPAPPQVAKN